ncbi:DNA internalization-related competence protein ComEC/Rec2 [Parahaliea sp. F7430]|uniref:DNA internalization-related competence protein ComEC/Rec2 n=1 Tax=Sediminihaliea albiluteola TaxID=2758564 RepID=A0A7W2TUG6_9GAMM|nr:DNA internalization-related competence protein ComEC/Rec2 [Sediminihaliea albiluteola]MBA6412124.1 DNA internalization-related competence protein ComEC/Rec2 [Sediminihaliea albiluteola]
MQVCLASLALGLLISAWLSELPSLPWAVLAALGSVLCCWLGRIAIKAEQWAAPYLVACSFITGLSLGLLMGVLHGTQLLSHQLPQDCVRSLLQVQGRIISLPRVTVFREQQRQQRFEFAVEHLSPAYCSAPKRLLLAYYGDADLLPGERWQFELRLKRPWGMVNPGSFNMQSWFASSGIHATGSVRKATAVKLPSSLSLANFHHRVRAGITAKIAALELTPESRAVLQAVTVADRSGIDSSLWRLCQHFGVNHLLVISGLHIGLVALVGFALGRVLALPLLLMGYQRSALIFPSVLALLLATAYTALAGFSLATVRALTMLACVVVASLCARAAGSWRNLLLAAALLLIVNPLAGLSSGFWLSFAAVACLLWLALWQSQTRLWWQAAATHGYMALAMLPLCAWWFGGFSQLAAPSNLLLVPLLGFYVVPLALCATALSLAGLAAAQTLWLWAAWPLEYLIPAAYALDSAQPQWLYRNLSPGPLAACIGLAAVAMAALPNNWRMRLLLPVFLLPLVIMPRQARLANDEAVHLLFIDVGQGNAVLLYNKHHALLYDTGGGVPGNYTVAESVIIPLLRERGIAKLDTLIVSHADSDHSAGLLDLMDRVPVAALKTGIEPLHSFPQQACRAGSAWQWPGSSVRFRVLAPANERGLSRNNGSCVLQIHIADRGILLAGDIDVDRERALVRYWGEDLRSDWLLAAHHGSASSSAYAWLKTVQPQHIVFSHGYANRFGHPHPEVLRRSRQIGAELHSTAEQGAIELIFAADFPPQVIKHRHLRRFYWM